MKQRCETEMILPFLVNENENCRNGNRIELEMHKIGLGVNGNDKKEFRKRPNKTDKKEKNMMVNGGGSLDDERDDV